jgi:hypothetical protein
LLKLGFKTNLKLVPIKKRTGKVFVAALILKTGNKDMSKVVYLLNFLILV